MTPSYQRAIKAALFSLVLMGLFFLLLPDRSGQRTRASSAGFTGQNSAWYLRSAGPKNPTGTVTSTERYLPIVHVIKPPDMELLNSWMADSNGDAQQAFLPGDDLSYRTVVLVNPPSTFTGTLTINSSGLCDAGQIFNGELVLNQGAWEHSAPAQAQNCTGLFTTTTILGEKQFTPTRTTNHVVNQLSQVVISDQAGFDKCAVPSIDKMQTWWDESPYSVINLYIGGIAFACPNQALDAVWIYKAAKQGWTFIPTWVGPQAPCTGYNHRISSNSSVAFQEGKDEALAAAEASRKYGFFGGNIIYYDLEAFPNASTSCREATDAFMAGWTEQLHNLGYKAGGYGQECSSYITDWVDNSPSPDGIWWARWPFPPWNYDPTASAYGSSCIPDNYWDDHQRIRQYTGGHSETWGETALTIDSNVLDGEVNHLPTGSPREAGDLQPVTLIREGPIIHDVGLVNSEEGWVWAGERILTTLDGGVTWDEVTPENLVPLGVSFLNPQMGWSVGFGDGVDAIQVVRTINGGLTWSSSAIPLDDAQTGLVESAFIEVLDGDSIWIALRLQSGASFSRGLLFYSADGGESWEQRQAPLGDPVFFLDADHGWSAGGPAGDKLYETINGGRTWQETEQPLPEAMLNRMSPAQQQLPASASTAEFFGDQYAWAIVQEGSCTGDKIAPADGIEPEPLECIQRWSLMATDNGGLTWQELRLADLK